MLLNFNSQVPDSWVWTRLIRHSIKLNQSGR